MQIRIIKECIFDGVPARKNAVLTCDEATANLLIAYGNAQIEPEPTIFKAFTEKITEVLPFQNKKLSSKKGKKK